MRPYKICAAILLFPVMYGCSSTTVVKDTPPVPEVPEYVKVPHPNGFELSSLRAIFYSPLAPKDIQGEFAKTCDSEFQKLLQLSQSQEERQRGAEELVSSDPERMHWCFYGKISKLQENLQSDGTWGERQRKVIETFSYLSPTANAFLNVYHDSRYLRWAVQYYSKISEWVFFRRVVPGPETTAAIMRGVDGPENMEPWVTVDKKDGRESIFAKYGISLAPTVASGANPLDQAARVPASAPEEPAAVKEEAKAAPEPIKGLDPLDQ